MTQEVKTVGPSYSILTHIYFLLTLGLQISFWLMSYSINCNKFYFSLTHSELDSAACNQRILIARSSKILRLTLVRGERKGEQKITEAHWMERQSKYKNER